MPPLPLYQIKSMKNIAKILAAATVAFAGAPAMADVDGLKLNSVTSNSAQNVQSNSGAVNLAPMGGLVASLPVVRVVAFVRLLPRATTSVVLLPLASLS